MIARPCLPGFYAALICAAFALPVLRAEDAPAPADPQKLIELLEKGDFDQRKDAAKKLEALGDRARTALEKALKESDSPEIRDTVERLLAALQRTKVTIEAIDMKGRPLAGVEGTLTISFPGQVTGEEEVRPVQIKTDAEGRFAQGGVNTGAVYINVQWQHYEAVFPENVSLSYVSLQPGETRVRFILQKGGSVAGKVLSADGDTPLEAAAIQLIADEGQDQRNIDLEEPDVFANDGNTLSGNSDAKGEFTIQGVPPGRYFVIARHPEHVSASCGAVNVEEDARAQLEIPARLVAKAKVLGAIQIKLLDSKGEIQKDMAFTAYLHELHGGAQSPEQRAQARQKLLREIESNGAQERNMQITSSGEGVAEVKDLLPGTYSLTLYHPDNEDEIHYFPSVKVEAGKTASLADAKPIKSGTLSGVIIGGGNRNGHNFNVVPMNWACSLDLLVLNDVQKLAAWFNTGSLPMAECDDKGHFELKGLVPGRFSLCVLRDQSIAGIIHGVEIASGKTTVVPDFKLTAPDFVAATVKGIILLPDGKPAISATINLTTRPGNSISMNAGEDGTFTLDSLVEKGSPAQLIAGLAGYKPYHLNLATPGIDLANLRIVLEKQIYGSASVLVRDSEGRPLKGAVVEARHSELVSFYSGITAAKNHVTDKSGRTVMKGLTIGKRDLNASLDGYYLDKSINLTVQPNVEASVELVMKRGLNLSGSVSVPQGIDPSKVLVSLHRAGEDPAQNGTDPIHIASVDAKGHFELRGVRPGKVRLYGQYPGLLTKHAAGDFDFEITEKPVELSCKMIAAGTLKFEAGKERRGANLILVEPNKWKSAISDSSIIPRAEPGDGLLGIMRLRILPFMGGLTVNSLGQTQACSHLPGRYDVLATKGTAEPFEELNDSREVHAATVFSGIEIAGATGKTALLRLPDIDTSASLAGKIVLNADSPWQADEVGIGNLALTIEGERATADVTFSIPESVDPAHAMKAAGAPPPGFRLQQPGDFSVSGLAPGEYKIFCNFEHYEGQGWSWNLKRSRGPNGAPLPVKPIKTFTVTKGQALALGDIAIELPAAERKLMREQRIKQTAAQAEMNLNNANEDDPADFQP